MLICTSNFYMKVFVGNSDIAVGGLALDNRFNCIRVTNNPILRNTYIVVRALCQALRSYWHDIPSVNIPCLALLRNCVSDSNRYSVAFGDKRKNNRFETLHAYRQLLLHSVVCHSGGAFTKNASNTSTQFTFPTVGSALSRYDDSFPGILH